MNQFDFSYLLEILNFVFHILVIFVICLMGALSSDIWYYKKQRESINIIQDIIGSLVFAVLLNIIDIFVSWDIRLYIGISYFAGLFSIDLLGLLLQPKFLLTFVKNLFAEIKNPATKAFSNTMKDYKDEVKEQKTEEKEELNRKERKEYLELRREELEIEAKKLAMAQCNDDSSSTTINIVNEEDENNSNQDKTNNNPVG